MKRNVPIKHRIFAPIDGELVNLNSLSEDERERIGKNAITRFADCLMWSQGYVREKDNNKKTAV